MRVMVIGANEKKLLADLRKNAEANRFNRKQFLEMVEQVRPAPIDVPGFSCTIPYGFSICFSLEEQPRVGWCRHLSVAVDDPARVPNPPAVGLLMEELGFKHCNLEVYSPDIHVWTEDLSNGGKAINVLERIKE
jgi:hypothetical protein